MTYKRILTPKEIEYIDLINLFNLRNLGAADFKKLTEIRNDCLGVNLRAVVGCGSCARTLVQQLKNLYLITEEQLKKEQDATTSTTTRIQERDERQQQGQTEGSSEQDNEGDKGSVSEASGEQPSESGQVAPKRRRGRPRKSNQSNAKTKRVHPPKTGSSGSDS